jgi:WD40 repeat protein
MAVGREARTAAIVTQSPGSLWADPRLVDLEISQTRPVPGLGSRQGRVAVDPTASVLAQGSEDGVVRVGRLDGNWLHLLVGHEGPANWLAVSPDLKWVASAGRDHSLRLWPMPDLDEPPLHTLPHDDLLARLKSLTNLRAVRNPESATGWTIEVGPFPGWKEVPEW